MPHHSLLPVPNTLCQRLMEAWFVSPNINACPGLEIVVLSSEPVNWQGHNLETSPLPQRNNLYRQQAIHPGMPKCCGQVTASLRQ